MTPRRERLLVRLLLTVLAGTVCGLAVACVAVWVTGDEPSRPTQRVESEPATARATAAVPRARVVLRRWDAARAAAWRAGDVTALRDLYTPGSAAGARDVRMLQRWTARGRRVTSMTTQVLALRVLEESEDRLVLQVTDRLARVEAGTAVLPRDAPSGYRLALRRRSGGADQWRVAWVTSRPVMS